MITIQKSRLYRDKYETFEEYCRISLEMSRTHAYNLIGSTEVYDELSANADIKHKPKNEFQVRSLIALPTEKRLVAWKKAEAEADGKPVTAKIVRQAASEFKPKGVSTPIKAAAKTVNRKLNLKPAFKLLGEIEKLADKNKTLLAKVTALRKCLQKIGAE